MRLASAQASRSQRQRISRREVTPPTGKERRIKRWEHAAVVEAMERRPDRAPEVISIRRQTVEHPFGTLKARMGSTHFQMKTLKYVRTVASPRILADKFKRLIAILGVGPLIAAIQT